MSFNSFIPGSRTLVATVTAGLTGTIVYHYLTTKYFNNENYSKPTKQNVQHLEVPRDTVAYLIGRNGETVKKIESQNNVSVSFIDSSNANCKLTVIRGSKEGVEKAKEQLLKLVQEFSHLQTEEIFVSQRIIDRLTANGNLKMQEVASTSNTRIFLYGLTDKVPSLLVRGTFLNIQQARKRLKSLAEEEIPEETRLHKGHTPTVTLSSLKIFSCCETLEADSHDGFCEVMISAIESPSKFFVQRAGPLSKELDRLIESMTGFYGEQENRVRLAATDVDVGLFVAAFLDNDNNWYRAKITSIENGANESIYHVSLLDFGDDVVLRSDRLAVLDADFLKMKFQAIECRLANVKPVGSDQGWSEKVNELFDRITYCAQWRILMAKVESVNLVHEKQIYLVKLVDTNTEKDIDIAQEIINQGFGV